MSGKWWKKPIRAVTLELPAADIKKLNVREAVRELSGLGVNMINAFAISYWPGGVAYYQSHIAPRHPDLHDRDLLTEVIDEAHKHKTKVVAYVNCLWGNKDLYEKYPDWAQRRVNGKPSTMGFTYTSVAMCPNGRYRDYFLRIVKEISDNYDVDGFYFDEPAFTSWCDCINCRKLFEEQFAKELPKKADWSNPFWQTFIKWRYDCITDFKKALYEKSKKEGRAIFFQHAFPLAFFPISPELSMMLDAIPELSTILDAASEEIPELSVLSRFALEMANWYIPQIYGAKLQDVAEFEDIIHFELYRVPIQRPLWWYGICARLGRCVGGGKPVLVLNMQGNSPFDLISLPEAELRLAIGEIVANNAQPLFAMYYPDVADRRGWETVGKCFRELKECEEYLTDMDSVKFAAVLHSQKTTDRFDSDAKKTRHVDCLIGVCRALLQEHLLFDVIIDRQLKKELQNFKVFILPNVSCMSQDEKEIIREFVKNGGGLVATYETSMYDERGDIQAEIGLNDVFGVNYLGYEKKVSSYDSYMQIKGTHPLTKHLHKSTLIPSEGTQLAVKTIGEAKGLASLIEQAEVHYAPLGEDTGIPTIIVNQYGKGRAVYFPGPIGFRYLSFGLLDHRKLIAEAVKWVARCLPPVNVENCPDTVELTAFKQSNGNRFILHLVNSIRNQIQEPITHVSCERDIRVSVQVPEEKPRYRAKLIPEKIELVCEGRKGSISLNIPELKYHKIVVIEKTR